MCEHEQERNDGIWCSEYNNSSQWMDATFFFPEFFYYAWFQTFNATSW